MKWKHLPMQTGALKSTEQNLVINPAFKALDVTKSDMLPF